MRGRVTARQQRACKDGASSGGETEGGGRSLTSATGGASARGPAERARARARDSQPGHARGLLPEPGVSPHLLAAVVECAVLCLLFSMSK
uniref:Uncharacterized protein n=1 Tax=Globodera rostochiensis TaxID=31243 RepID=A0A914I295_GLORO